MRKQKHRGRREPQRVRRKAKGGPQRTPAYGGPRAPKELRVRPARGGPVHRKRLSRAKAKDSPPRREPSARARARLRRAVNKAGQAQAPVPQSGPGPLGPAAAGADPVGQAAAQAGPGEPHSEIRPAEATVDVVTAARLLGISRRTVQVMLQDGRLKGWRVPPRGWWKISREALARLGACATQQVEVRADPQS